MKLSNETVIKSLLEQTVFCDVIIELGANVGLITQQLVLQNKKVYAFEPEPVAFDELKKFKLIIL